jgi:hypothetical protein
MKQNFTAVSDESLLRVEVLACNALEFKKIVMVN